MASLACKSSIETWILLAGLVDRDVLNDSCRRILITPSLPWRQSETSTDRGQVDDGHRELLPDGGNLNMCLTCGACSSGCPASGLGDMDPRKFLRMASLGMDEEILSSSFLFLG